MKTNTGAVILLVALIVSAFLALLWKRAELLAWFKSRTYRPKRAEKKCGSNDLSHLLAPSVIGACLCAICLCGTSWAWFTASVSTATTKIQTAAYTVSVTAMEDTTAVSPTADQGTYTIPISGGKSYTITIAPTGTAQNGYCKVNFEETNYYTTQLAESGTQLTFTVHASKDGVLTITPQWGTCAIAGEKIGNGSEDLKELGTKAINSTDSAAQDSAPEDVTQSAPLPEDTEEAAADTLPEPEEGADSTPELSE